MKKDDNSLLIAQTLMSFFDFEWSRLTMYCVDDIYNRIPQLIFRLRDKSQYDKVENCIGQFKGNMQWVMYKYQFSKNDNYIIAPYVVYEIERNHYERGESIDAKVIFSTDRYKSICEKAIEDIPKLALYINNYFNNY